MESHDISSLEEAIVKAEKAAGFMAVKRRGAQDTWYATTHAVNATMLYDAKHLLEQLKAQLKDAKDAQKKADAQAKLRESDARESSGQENADEQEEENVQEETAEQEEEENVQQKAAE